MKLPVALIQLCSTADVEQNLKISERLIRKAAASGAQWVLLPENFAYLRSEGEPLAFKDSLPGKLSQWGADLSRELEIWLTMGSFPEQKSGSKKAYNTSVTFAPDGKRVATYRKVHLFDIDIEGGPTFTESATIAGGDALTHFDAPWGRVGVSICYDLRFPELYRQLAFKGCQFLCVPAAFTAQTGKAHWLALLRARAIENLAFILAPAQVGKHSKDRESFGHSVIFDPWGRQVALKKQGVGVLQAELGLNLIKKSRKGIPTFNHVRRWLWKTPRIPRDLC